MVETFGRYLAPLLIAAHTANHTEGFVEKEVMQVENNSKDKQDE